MYNFLKLKYIINLLILLLLTSCGCVGPIDVGNLNEVKESYNFSFSKDDKWLDTGIFLQKNTETNMQIEGNLNCSRSINVDVNANNSNWVNSMKIFDEEIVNIILTNPQDKTYKANNNGLPHILGEAVIIELFQDNCGVGSSKIIKGLGKIKDVYINNNPQDPYENFFSLSNINLKVFGNVVNSTSLYSIYFVSSEASNICFKFIDNRYEDNSGVHRFRVEALNEKCEKDKFELSYYVGTQNPDIIGAKTKKLENISNSQIYAEQDGRLWIKAKVNHNAFSINSQMSLQITKYLPKLKLATFLTDKIINPIKEKSNFVASMIYNDLTKDAGFQKIIRAALTLYIMIYGISYIFGLTNFTQRELVHRGFKIAILLILISPQSFSIFNQYFFKFFTEGYQEIILKITGANKYSNDVAFAHVFGFFERALSIIFTAPVWVMISALIFDFTGIVVFFILIYTLYKYVFVLLEALIGFLIVIVSISILIALAPIFIACLLFNATRSYFEGWFKYLVNFSLQPIVLFALLAILNDLVMGAFANLMSYSACWTCKIPIIIDLNVILKIIGIESIFTLPVFDIGLCIPWYGVFGVTSIDLFMHALVFLSLVGLTIAVLNFAPQMADFLSSVVPGSGTDFTGRGSDANSLTDSAKQGLKSIVGQDRESKARRAQQKNEKEETNKVNEKIKRAEDEK